MMITKVQPSLKKDINIKKFTWRIDRFRNLKETELHSYAFLAGRHKWRIHVCKMQDGISFLSAYSHYGHSETTTRHGWSGQPDFSLTLVDQLHGTSSLQICSTTTNEGRKVNWGSHFVPMSHFSTKGFLVNSTLVVEAQVFTEDITSAAAADQPSEAIELSLTKQQLLSPEIQVTNHDIERQTLADFLQMSLQEISEANAFDKVEEIVVKISQNAPDPLKKTALKNVRSRLAKFKKSIPKCLSTIEVSNAVETSRRRTAKELEGRLVQKQNQIRHLETKVSRIWAAEANLESEIKLLIALKDKIAQEQISTAAELEETNQDASRELEELKKQMEKCNEAAEFKIRAKEKVARCNASWKLFAEFLGL